MIHDRTSIYVFAIIGIVLVVGLVYAINLPGNNVDSNNALTGNVVVADVEYSTDNFAFVEYSSVFKTLLGLSLVGAFVFMYHKF